MESRFEFDDFLEPFDPERSIRDGINRDGHELLDKSAYPSTRSTGLVSSSATNSQAAPRLDDYYNSNPIQNGSYGLGGPESFSREVLGDTYLDNEIIPPPAKNSLALPTHENPVQRQGSLRVSTWANDASGHPQQAQGMPMTEKAPSVSSPMGDPVINVFAPDEAHVESKPYADSIFPMYSANGVPIRGTQVSEFQQRGGPEIQPRQGYDSSQVGLTSPTSPASTGHTPYGTPQTSPFIVPASPNAASSIGSPLIGNDPSQYHFNDEGDLGPLIDDSQSLFDTNSLSVSSNMDFPQQGYSTGSLAVPIGSRKSRALSDSWTAHERDAFLESLDAQMQLTHRPPMSSSQRVDRDLGFDPAADSSTIQFPSYPQAYDKGGARSLSYGNSIKAELDESSGSIGSGDLSPNSPMTNLNNDDAASSIRIVGNSAQLSIPISGRARSASNPYDTANDLKSAQMFSCELCGKRFTRAYNLRSHMRTHTDERPFACQHCGKAFARQHDRKRHEALHSGEKRFVCYGLTHGFQWGCRKRFARADALGRHFRTEAGKNCLKPLIDQICANGSYKETAPEGIIFTGVIDNQPQLVLSVPERDSGHNLSTEEREDQTRRTVIVTAVAEQFQEMVGAKSDAV